jgi:hypothetical protein
MVQTIVSIMALFIFILMCIFMKEGCNKLRNRFAEHESGDFQTQIDHKQPNDFEMHSMARRFQRDSNMPSMAYPDESSSEGTVEGDAEEPEEEYGDQ